MAKTMKIPFKRITLFSGALAAGLSVGGALAQTSAELTMSGTITPPACRISLEDASVDFGERRHASLNRNAETAYTVRQTALNIQCDDVARAGFSLQDNRRSSVLLGGMFQTDFTSLRPPEPVIANETLRNLLAATGGPKVKGGFEEDWAYRDLFFGLGVTGEQQPIGFLSIAAQEANMRIVDAQKASTDALLLEGDAAASTRWARSEFSRNGGSQLRPGKWYSTGTTEGGNRPVAFQSLRVPLLLLPTIARGSSLRATDRIVLDGSVTFTLHYL